MKRAPLHFKRYGAESQRPGSRLPEVLVDDGARRLGDAFRNFAYGRTDDPVDSFPRFLEAVRSLDKSPGAVEVFSMSAFEDSFISLEKAGLFLSALVNSGGDAYVLRPHGFQLNSLGYLNTKDVTIHGDAGSSLGAHMLAGCITLLGSAGHGAGVMMEGGRIRISGDAGRLLGFGRKGGEIHVGGRIEDLTDVRGSDGVFHKGKPIPL
jgi:hypothetical protein